MSSIDPLGSSLYFSAAAQVSQDKAKEAANKKKSEKIAQSKVPFASILKKNQEAEELAEAGFPPEIAGLSTEDAVAFLKDAVDSAGDELTQNMSAEAFKKYRDSIGQFMRYIVKNSFEIEKHRRPGLNRKGKPRDAAVQIQIINQRLDTIASDLLYNHADKIKMLDKVKEIQGLIVDLLAA